MSTMHIAIESKENPLSNCNFNPWLITIFIDCRFASDNEIERHLCNLQQQTHRNFEIVILNDSYRLSEKIDRCRGVFALHGVSFSDVLSNTNSRYYRGDYLLFLPHNAVLAPIAIEKINLHLLKSRGTKKPDIVIFDFKTLLPVPVQNKLPGWDPDLIQHLNYISYACCLSSDLIAHLSAGGPYDCLWKFLKLAAQSRCVVVHISDCLAEFLQPIGPAIKLEAPNRPLPSLTIVIPNKNSLELIMKCCAFLYELDFSIQVVIVDNQSSKSEVWEYYEKLASDFDVVVVPYNLPFNYSSMINRGVQIARYEFVLLLNNDVCISSVNSLKLALAYAETKGVGVVGSLLRYPDGSVQHAGIILRRLSTDDYDTKHVLRNSRHREDGHIGSLSAPRNWQCVTGAFQIVRKTVFDEVGGYDEISLPIEFNDIDFCLKVRSRGYRVVCLPLGGIVHDESRTRSTMDKNLAQRSSKESYELMRSRWPNEYSEDPFVGPERVIGASKSKTKGRLSLWLRKSKKGLVLKERSNPSNRRLTAQSLQQTRLRPGVSIIGPFTEESQAGEVTRQVVSACDHRRMPISIVDTTFDRFQADCALSTMCVPYPDRLINFRILEITNRERNFRVPHEGRRSIAYLDNSTDDRSLLNERLEVFDQLWIGPQAIINHEELLSKLKPGASLHVVDGLAAMLEIMENLCAG